MDVIIDSLVRLPPDTPKNALRAIRRGLTLPNPEFYKRQGLGLSLWGVEPTVCFLRYEQDGWHTAPRGSATAALVKSAAPDARFTDKRICDPIAIIPNRITLRDYQEDSVDKLVKNVQGIIQAPCGSGKTVMGVAAMVRTGQRTLILVHTSDLVHQWVEEIETLTELKAGVISEGKTSITDATVATVQSLHRMPRDKLERLGLSFGTVIVDEAHHVPAETFTHALSYLPGKYRFGLTATPERDDDMTPLMAMTIGATVGKVDHELLIKKGHLIRPEIQPVRTRCGPWAADYNGLVQELCADEERTKKLLGLICSTNRLTLVLANRVQYCRDIAERLKTRGVNAESVDSKVPKKKRKNRIEAFKKGGIRILCATNLADEGLDVSLLEALVLALPARSHGRTTQRLGRLMRPGNKQTPILFDLIDDHPIAQRQWYSRRNAYKQALGSPIYRKQVKW